MNTLLKPVVEMMHARLVAESVSLPTPSDPPQAHASGLDPDRIFLFGTHEAAGRGVVSHQLALTGRLAEEVSQVTSRGVDVDFSAHTKRTIRTAAQTIKGQKLQKYDAVVVALGETDARVLTHPRRWYRAMESLLHTIQADSSDSTPIVVTGIHPIEPVPGLAVSVTKRIGDHVSRLNHATQQLCYRQENVTFVPFPALLLSQKDQRQTSAAYSSWARSIAHHLAPRLPGPGSYSGGERRAARQIRSMPQSSIERQSSLRDLGVVESGAEERFDRIVNLARSYFRVSYAAFILADGQDTWFKSKSGFRGAPDLETLAIATIDSGRPLVIPNMANHVQHRLSIFPGRSEKGFYAGYPIEAPDGHRIGVLCVLDAHPRSVKAMDKVMLRDLAMMLQRELWTSPTGEPGHE
ncbi:MAG: GAF domain-containing protein [Homoserinimonas sp.]